MGKKRAQILQTANQKGSVLYSVIEREGQDPEFIRRGGTERISLVPENNRNFIIVPKNQTPLQHWKKIQEKKQLKERVRAFEEETAGVTPEEAIKLDELMEWSKTSLHINPSDAEATRRELTKFIREYEWTDDPILRESQIKKYMQDRRGNLKKDIEDARKWQKEASQATAVPSGFMRALEDMRDAWGVNLVDGSEYVSADFSKLVLMKNEHSSLHRLREAMRTNRVFMMEPEDGNSRSFEEEDNDTACKLFYEFLEDFRTFVVAHDWAKIISVEVTDEVRLPFEKCSFEYRYSDRNVIVLATQTAGHSADFRSFYESKTGDWLPLTGAQQDIPNVWMKAVKAACVMLETKVAVHEVIRAPAALNAKRIKAGKAPLADFHIIDLSRRYRQSRAAPNPSPEETGRHMRLHWVRGHWRDYENHRTWVEWYLRGDPDLGFVDKLYKL